MPSLDTVTWPSPFRNCSGVRTAQIFSHCQTPCRLDYKHLPKLFRFQFTKTTFQKQKHYSPLVRASSVEAVTLKEPSFSVFSDDNDDDYPDMQLKSNSQIIVSLPPNEGFSSEIDDREKLRRSRISKANKGNVPWNKGRKHSPETLKKIREKTRLAMQNPKVKLKLMNIGHAQSEETRVKIGIGVREGWVRRRKMLSIQENCRMEWQGMIAEASRLGFDDEEELQWDSYTKLDEELKKEWLESIEKRKTSPKPKGSKRAPKSLEQRRKISEAISAKWNDQGYRGRVCSALAKYHGAADGGGSKPRKQNPTRVKKKPVELGDVMFELTVMKKSKTVKKKRTIVPKYKDPMASTKLDMIKKIKAQRTEMDVRKREAIDRAKMLIADAEEAARSLEVAALTNAVARCSLIETRKLIAEATRSLASIERGEMKRVQNNSNSSKRYGMAVRHPPYHEAGPQINGKSQYSSVEKCTRMDLNFDKLALQSAVNGEEICDGLGFPSRNLEINNIGEGKKSKEETTSLQGGQSKEVADNNQHDGFTAAKTKKKWICGRLVEVAED